MGVMNSGEFDRQLQDHPFENVRTIKAIDGILRQQRGFAVRKIKKSEPVILLVSGGIDSTVAWEYLLKKSQAKVFPLTIKREVDGLGVQYLKAVKYFSKYFSQKYPKQNQPIDYFNLPWFPEVVKKELKRKKLAFFHPKSLNRFIFQDKISFALGSLEIDLQLILALVYRNYLYARKNIEAETIVTGILPADGLTVRGQTLTHLRELMLTLSDHRFSRNLQITSPFFERENGSWLTKTEVVKLAKKWGLPIVKTWSCNLGNWRACGLCNSCLNRKRVFEELKIGPKKSEPLENWIYKYFKWINLGTGMKGKIYNTVVRAKQAFSDD